MTDRVRLASVGVGRWAGIIADAVEAGGEAEIVSCFSRNADNRVLSPSREDAGRLGRSTNCWVIPRSKES